MFTIPMFYYATKSNIFSILGTVKLFDELMFAKKACCAVVTV